LDFSTINQKNYPNKEAATFALGGTIVNHLLIFLKLFVSIPDVQNAQDAFMCQRELYYARSFLLNELFSSLLKNSANSLTECWTSTEPIVAQWPICQ